MKNVTSADGTSIAFEQLGEGPPLIMVVGAFNTRATTEPLANALRDRFTILNYDRRGRGESGDTSPYAVEREIEDIEALIVEAGGRSAVFGYSSGATLALKAAARGAAITRLALYDAPFLVDDSHPRLPVDLPDQLTELISAGRRGEAVELYQTKAVGIPPEIVVRMREAPFRPGLEAIAHTLPYDAAIIGDLSFPTELIASITTPTLVIDGEKSPPIMHGAARMLAQTLPNNHARTLPDQTHDISPEATAAVLMEFLSG